MAVHRRRRGADGRPWFALEFVAATDHALVRHAENWTARSGASAMEVCAAVRTHGQLVGMRSEPANVLGTAAAFACSISVSRACSAGEDGAAALTAIGDATRSLPNSARSSSPGAMSVSRPMSTHSHDAVRISRGRAALPVDRGDRGGRARARETPPHRSWLRSAREPGSRDASRATGSLRTIAPGRRRSIAHRRQGTGKEPERRYSRWKPCRDLGRGLPVRR